MERPDTYHIRRDWIAGDALVKAAVTFFDIRT
jgi:hypothetical protein